MNIRGIQDEDLEGLLHLWNACGFIAPGHDVRGDILRARETASAELLVGVIGEAIAASVMVGFDGHRGWMYYVAVLPDARRAGLGSRMVEAAQRWLRERGATKLLLMVEPGNVEAIALYRKLGFDPSPMAVYGKPL